jgi:DNA-binding transcriptional MerR regulator
MPMADAVSDRPYLSIGEVLALLLEEFPDVTISKIRFLESQGLIDPERTPSGYRKFYDPDVERLRVILREQRQNFLPLRVIRDRLESGQIDDSGGFEISKEARAAALTAIDGGVDDTGGFEFDDETGELSIEERPHTTARHPAAAATPRPVPAAAPSAPTVVQFVAADAGGRRAEVRDTYLAADLCAAAGITAAQLADLESFGLVSSNGSGAAALYSASEFEIARAAAGFLNHGVEARHLRGWRQAAEREASLFEQMVLPLLRQRNPQARQQAATVLEEMSRHGADLRAALLSSLLQRHLDA